MGLLDFLFGKPKRRRRSTRRKPNTRRELDRQASAWLRTDDRRKAREKRQDERRVRREMMMAKRADSAYRRQKASLRKDGWTDSEIDELLHGLGVNPARRQERMSAACGRLCIANPTAAEASALFHGTPTKTRDGKVVIGSLENVQYRAPAGSSRAGVTWDHAAGDRGMLRPRNRGRARLLADPNTGKVELDTRGSGMRFDPRRGLVG